MFDNDIATVNLPRYVPSAAGGDFSVLVITCQLMRRHSSVCEVLLHVQRRLSDSPAVLRTFSSPPVGLFGNYRGVTAITS